MAKKRSRRILTLGTVALIAGAFAYAFWPRPTLVDIGEVTRGPMIVTIDEEARTRVHDAYVVSTPIAGRLLRVDVLPGDRVIRRETIVAQMLPTNPAALDVRTREQANAAVTAAEAALRVARADMNKAIADKDLTDLDLNRAVKLASSGTVSEAALDRAKRTSRAAAATLGTTEAAISMREAELENTRARLIGFDDLGLSAAIGGGSRGDEIPLFAPADGRILRVLQKSETTLPVGSPIMEIGNIESGLEIVVELLSTDAVKVVPGNRVIIDNWGGDQVLEGVVRRIDPWGFTKYSALGVEEQRVLAVIEFTSPPEIRENLGHGFRVEARIVVWESDDTLIVPSSALFRERADWAVFLVEEERAILQKIEIGKNNGISAHVQKGIELGANVVLYPSSGLTDGDLVAQRSVK